MICVDMRSKQQLETMKSGQRARSRNPLRKLLRLTICHKLQDAKVESTNQSKSSQLHYRQKNKLDFLTKSYNQEEGGNLVKSASLSARSSASDQSCSAIIASNNMMKKASYNETSSRINEGYNNSNSFSQAMYTISSAKLQSIRSRFPHQAANRVRRLETNRERFFGQSSMMGATLLALLLTSSLLVTESEAFFWSTSAATSNEGEPSVGSALASSLASAIQDNTKPSASNSNEKLLSTIQEAASIVASVAAPAAVSALAAAVGVPSPAMASPVASAIASQGSPVNPSNSPSLGSQSYPPSAPASSGPVSSPSSSSSSSSSSSASSSASSPSSSVANSLVSSLSSAAAAVAAAAVESHLSGGDARSLLNGSQNNRQNGHSAGSNHHQSRTPALHLALKIADAIPEVPYNILHNMKKIDHAAPFYNVAGKSNNIGNMKESSSLLAGALSSASSGRFGGAAEHLSTLLKSPLWKRIADGYGEFTSEFRSLFRIPANTMKGPTSSTTKLLRDISVPALLMLIASTIPNDWRPVRTRRKSLLQTDLMQAVDPLNMGSSDSVPSISAIPMFSTAPQMLNVVPQVNPFQANQQIQSRLYNQASGSISGQQGVLGEQVSSPLARSVDVSLPSAETNNLANWMIQPIAEQAQQRNQQQPQPQQHLQLQLIQQQSQSLPSPVSQNNQIAVPISPVRRVGDLAPLKLLTESQANNIGNQVKEALVVERPVNSGEQIRNVILTPSSSAQNSGGFISSLTSNLVNHVGGSRLMRKIMNANSVHENGASHVNSYRQMGSGAEVRKMPPTWQLQRDQPTDRHRYSLIEADNHDLGLLEQRNAITMDDLGLVSVTPSKPSFLSAMTQAISSVFSNPQQESGFVSSYLNPRFETIQNINHMEQDPIGEKSINHKESILRRNQAQQPVQPGSEQRELSQFIPQSWKDVVKRTVNNVQKQATTQWRSIEGQLSNWVQDKLKSNAVTQTGSNTASPSYPPSTTQTGTASSTPVANILASMGSTAMNIFGLAGNKSSTMNPASANQLTTDSSAPTSNDSPSNTLRNKNDAPAKKSAFAGVANLIVNTFTNRQQSSSTNNNGSKTVKDTVQISSEIEPSSASSSVNHYPTITGTQISRVQSETASSQKVSTITSAAPTT